MAAKKTSTAGSSKRAHAATAAAAAKTTGAKKGTRTGIRVRMYRVGFGDFFLLTVPTPKHGDQHILIDCGVHAGNIRTMGDCVSDLIAETKRKLALVIVTHYHADHLSGFSTAYDEFAQFEVGAVWITNRLDPENPQALALQNQVRLVANQLAARLTARLAAANDENEAGEIQQALDMVENALGAAGSGNEKAMDLVTNGFSNKPPVYYYGAGDKPALPAALKGALTAEILSPAPKDSDGEFAASDNKTEQYLSNLSERGVPDDEAFRPFDREWPANAEDYQPGAFRPWESPKAFEEKLRSMRPDVLRAAADAVDGTLNNQSLVVLFECAKKRLLFVGDAQWGNWAYWLYGKSVKGKDPGITKRARDILGSIDFYKVGHHGSTNATPIPAVAAIGSQCAAMCSTETGYPKPKRTYGSLEKQTEVPRLPLMAALAKRVKGKLVRSDWLAIEDGAPASPEALEMGEKLPAHFKEGALFIDYFL